MNLTVIRWPESTSRPFHRSLTFGVEGAWGLTVELDTSTLGIVWSIVTDGAITFGGGIIWLNGRLTATGDDPSGHRRRFKDFIDSVGLSFGDIEAELRAMTGYQEEARPS